MSWESQLTMPKLFNQVVDRICAYLGMEMIPLRDRKLWPRTVFHPSQRQRQRDGWACGLFVIMAIKPCAHCEGFENVLNDNKELARVAALKSLLSVPEKRKAIDIIEPAIDDCEADAEKSDGEAAAGKKRRKPKRTEDERKNDLINDKWVKDFSKMQVRCRGCDDWIQLPRVYQLYNWTMHKDRCPVITGVKVIRVEGPKKSKFAHETPSLALQWRNEDPNSLKRTKSKASVELSPTQPLLVNCIHLSGPQYDTYIRLCRTRSLGGISPELHARAVRQLNPHKIKLPPLTQGRTKNPDLMIEVNPDADPPSTEVPVWGNTAVREALWTDQEKRNLDQFLLAWARWEVDWKNGWVRSTQCKKKTRNTDRVCDACRDVARDESLQHAVRKKVAEAAKSVEFQHEALRKRRLFTPHTSRLDTDARLLDNKLKDPLVFDIYLHLENRDHTSCFLSLYRAARNGDLDNAETFKQLCGVFDDRIRRETSENKNLKYGVRYPQHYLDFMTLMRSRGGSTARQYSILTSELGGPSPRHLRRLVSHSPDALACPYIVYENMARVKRLIDSVQYIGPISIAGDCTKVRARLAFSTDFGSHILGSTLPLDQVEVEEPEDIDRVIADIKQRKAQATQTRAIIAKIPLPNIPPLVIALLPTDGKDNSQGIHDEHMTLLAMADRLDMKIISFAADGAASELLAQEMMDREESEHPPLLYEYDKLGVSLKAPVFNSGPCISVSDAPHGRKTKRNNVQYGTHTASMGSGFITYRSLVDLFDTGKAGLVLKDVENVDKQDDGAARRVFHTTALDACTLIKDGVREVHENFRGLFVYLFVLGTLFDAWLSRTMNVKDRILCAFRARFWLHLWREHIVLMARKYPDLFSTKRSFISPAAFRIANRLCDTLILLALAYSKFYPDLPFCPWLLGTEFVEHFFGLARMILPNFSYAELFKMVQNIMVRQRILLSGRFKESREKSSGIGYELDIDATPLTPAAYRAATVSISYSEVDALAELGYMEAAMIMKELCKITAVTPTADKPLRLSAVSGATSLQMQSDGESSSDEYEEDVTSDEEGGADDNVDESSTIGEVTAVAARDAGRYSALCDDYESISADAASAGSIIITVRPPPLNSTRSVDRNETEDTVTAPLRSELVGSDGKLSIELMVKHRRRLQSGTNVNSERTIRVDPKFAIQRATEALTADGMLHKKMTTQEASQRARIAQVAGRDAEHEKKAREIRWTSVSRALTKIMTNTGRRFITVLQNLNGRNVNGFNYLRRGSFVVVRNTVRLYIGEVLDMYKTASRSRYGSVKTAGSVEELKYLSVRAYLSLTVESYALDDDEAEDSDSADAHSPKLFTCRHRETEIHTHTLAEHVLYHLDSTAFSLPSAIYPSLKPEHAKIWNAFNIPSAEKALLQTLPKIKIPGGKMGRGMQ
ncbi:hypothetical protein HWV62_17876 [Athelia sp. TMB]|nr:hypothetical protein HWV62_17876 [Athelia sp. TMB]